MKKASIKVYHSLMDESEKWAEDTRALLGEHGVYMLNIIGSPGCGKTTLLEHTVNALSERVRFAVLEGDPETSRDAERLHALGVHVNQIVTDGSCHLGARIIYNAVSDLPLDALDMVIVENVGNLVCPAGFDLGEAARVVVLSVTEGDDKPLKYPDAFATADLVVINKIDLLPYVDFDVDRCIEYARRLRPEVETLRLSATTGKGVAEWLDWIRGRRARLLTARRDTLAAELAAVEGALHAPAGPAAADTTPGPNPNRRP